METFNCLYECVCVRVCAHVCRLSLKPEEGARSQALDLHIENCEPMDVGTRLNLCPFQEQLTLLLTGTSLWPLNIKNTLKQVKIIDTDFNIGPFHQKYKQ